MNDNTASHEADQIVAELGKGQSVWAQTSVADRRRLLADLMSKMDRHGQEWVDQAARIKRLPVGSPLVGEEWMSGPWALLAFADALGQTLDRLERGESLLDGFPVRTVPGGRIAVKVMPHTLFDRLLLSGFSAEVWMKPGVKEDDVRRDVAHALRNPSDVVETALVLGAGNIFSIAPLDALDQLYMHNRVVVIKLNPVTDPLKPVLEKVFAPYIDLGVFRVVSGGADLGQALAQHSEVSAVHLTGSLATHDAIVWGTGEEGRANKAAGTPLLEKPITSELGGVSPVIVVPGQWSEADLEFQAQNVATMRLHNSGSNCIAAQILIVSSDWEQKDAFYGALQKALAQAPTRPAWYPGSEDRVGRARDGHSSVVEIGGTPERTLLLGLDAYGGEHAFVNEYFAPVLGATELPGTGAEFLAAAVSVSNDQLHGTLGAHVIVHPADRKAMGARFEQVVADLRYGSIGINVWTGLGFLSAHAVWGAFPGHTLDDVQSGIGAVHNALGLVDAERTVAEGPFWPAPRSFRHGSMSLSPKPPWFVDNKTADVTAKRLTSFAARPRWSALPGIFASALRG